MEKSPEKNNHGAWSVIDFTLEKPYVEITAQISSQKNSFFRDGVSFHKILMLFFPLFSRFLPPRFHTTGRDNCYNKAPFVILEKMFVKNSSPPFNSLSCPRSLKS